jgi:hypothetical protein
MMGFGMGTGLSYLRFGLGTTLTGFGGFGFIGLYMCASES